MYIYSTTLTGIAATLHYFKAHYYPSFTVCSREVDRVNKQQSLAVALQLHYFGGSLLEMLRTLYKMLLNSVACLFHQPLATQSERNRETKYLETKKPTAATIRKICWQVVEVVHHHLRRQQKMEQRL